MIAIISPAKSLDLSTPIECPISSLPELDEKKEPILKVLRKLKPKDISEIFRLSEKLAILNFNRFQSLGKEENRVNLRQAAYTFDGDVYAGLDFSTISADKINYAQDRLRILSGLYGVLKPCDMIEPYRLEMGTRLVKGKYKNLYHYWEKHVTKCIQQTVIETDSKYILNLASNEYSQVVQWKNLTAEPLQFTFLEKDRNELKNISFYSKRARGLMARFFLEYQPKTLSDFQGFDSDRYRIDTRASSAYHFVYIRDYMPLRHSDI